MIYTEFHSPFGTTFAAADNGRLQHLWFPNQKHEPDPTHWERDDSNPLFAELQQQLKEYSTGQRHSFDLPLDAKGTEFQESVWKALLAIPFGQYCSYGDLAVRLNRPKAARAVGAAVGRNPIGIVIPCHRVLGSTGKLTGFAAGLDMKSRLLQIENPQPELSC